MCYIQCSARRSKQSDLSSFTPLGELGRFCEAKCWQNWKGEKSLKLFGLDELVKEGNEWDIALKDYLVASYDHFKSVGLRSDRLIPSVEELFQGTVSSTSGSFLPVCNSYMPPKADSFSGIPCMCGDQYGSETLAFWKEANFASWIQSKDTGSQMTTRQAPYLCKNDMAIYRVAPVSYYLNLCNMGWHWPSQTENSSYLMRGADAACEPFKAAVDEWQERRKSDSPFPVGQGADVDCDMCYQNDVGKLVRHSQAALIDNLFFNSYNDAEFQNYNFRRACELYREIAPKGSGCELGIIIDGLPAKVIPSSMGSNPTVSNSTVLKSSTG